MLKRLLDIVGAAVGLVLLSPLLLGTALVIRLRDGSPVLFRQDPRRPARPPVHDLQVPHHGPSAPRSSSTTSST